MGILCEASEDLALVDSVQTASFMVKEAIRLRNKHTIVLVRSDIKPALQHSQREMSWHRLSIQFNEEKSQLNDQGGEEAASAPSFAGENDQKWQKSRKGPFLVDQIATTIDHFYPSWKETIGSTNTETLLIPSTIDIVESGWPRGPIDSESQDKVSVDLRGKLKGHEGERDFQEAFRKLNIGGVLIGGFETSQFATVMSERQTNFFGSYNGKKWNEKIKVKESFVAEDGSVKTKITAWKEKYPNAEYDFIFAHLKLGIYIFEVKGSVSCPADLMTDKNYTKAIDQIPRAKSTLSLLYKMITNAELPAQCLKDSLAFPFMEIGKVDTAEGFTLIGKKLLDNGGEFRQFMSDQLSANDYFHCDTNEYTAFMHFITTLIGYRSLSFVSHACNAVALHRPIDSQSYDKKSKQKGTVTVTKKNVNDQAALMKEEPGKESDTISDYLLHGFGRGAIVLNAEQLIAVEDQTKCQLISGPPGTGKTLVILEKVLRAAIEIPVNDVSNGNVVLCAYNPFLVPKFEHFIAANRDRFRRQVLLTSSITVARDEDDLFCDEMPVQKSPVNIYARRMSAKGRTVVAITGWMSPGNVKLAKMLVEEKLKGYKHFELSSVVRGSKRIITAWKERDWPREVALNFGHNIAGVSVLTKQESGTYPTLKALYDRISPYLQAAKPLLVKSVSASSEDESVEPFLPCHVAVLAECNASAELIKSYLSSKGIECGSPYEQLTNPNLVAVENYLKTMSFEWPIVFIAAVCCLDFYESMHLIGASRAMVRLEIVQRDYMQIVKAVDCQIGDRNLQELDWQTFRTIVDDAREQLDESEIDSRRYDDFRFSFIRHDYIPPSVRFVPFFQRCTSMTDCFQVIAGHSFLQQTCLQDEDLRMAIEMLKQGRFDVGERIPTLIENLWENVAVEQRQKRWKVVLTLVAGLESRKISASSMHDHEKLVAQCAQKNQAWATILDVISAYVNICAFSMGDFQVV